MPDAWETFRIEFKGGLVTNLSPLQQAINAPGSARILRNYEPSIDGGYKRIQGYEKFDSAIIAPYGNPVVNGASQSGTSLSLRAIHTTPAVGDTLTIDGVSGTYTVAFNFLKKSWKKLSNDFKKISLVEMMERYMMEGQHCTEQQQKLKKLLKN